VRIIKQWSQGRRCLHAATSANCGRRELEVRGSRGNRESALRLSRLSEKEKALALEGLREQGKGGKFL
jgi:hypothetical protein